MNPNEFLKEVLESRDCPKNFETIYSKFQFFQKEALRTLRELHRICENNSIPYQLAFGSLLGAVRDGGQIPWDYDIDVIIPYTYKNMLIDALKHDLDDDYYFYCPESNNKCRHVIMRLAPKGYRTEALHVDVFYYVGTPNNEKERKILVKKIKRVSHAHYLKLVDPVEESTGNLRKILGLYKSKIPLLFTSAEKLHEKYENLCIQYPIEKADICIEADSFADWYEFPKHYLENTELMETKMGTFRVSSYYRELLSIWYKDYLCVPSLDKRIAEVLYNMKRLTYFEKLK